MFFKFSDVNLVSDFIPFFKKVTLPKVKILMIVVSIKFVKMKMPMDVGLAIVSKVMS